MIDIVTVVFQEELAVLRLQAESIDLYCKEMDVGRIFIVVNDDNISTSDIDTAWWGQFSNQVVVMHRRDWNIDYTENGWLTQQLLKLITTSSSNNTWCMILDAKTILIQPVKLDRLFDRQDRLTWGYLPVFSVFEPARQQVSKLFQIDLQHVAGPAGIPFFFHTATVKDMITEVEKRTNQSFGSWFLEQGTVTEFILYSGYLQYRDGSLDKTYVNSPDGYALCNVCHSEVAMFDSKFLQMHCPNTLTISIHRNAWKELSITQKIHYQHLLLAHGITSAKELV